MNNFKNRILSVLLSVVVIAVLTVSGSITVFAAGETINVTSEAELTAALNKNSPVSAINVTGSFTVHSDCTIQYDAAHINNYHSTVMTIKKGVTLTVGEGGSIGSFWPSFTGDWDTPPTPNGKLINNGTVIVDDGGFIDADFDTNNGSLIIKEGGESVCCNTNNGTVTVENGGFYTTSQGMDSVNYGTLTVCYGAAVVSHMGSRIVNAEGGKIELDGEFLCGCLGYDGGALLFENRGVVTGIGSVTVYDCGPEEKPADLDVMIERMMAQLGQKTRFDDWDDIAIYKQITASSYNDIASALTGRRVVAGEHVEGDMDVKIFVVDNITMPAGASVRTMAMIIVNGGAGIVVSDGAVLECGLINKSTVEVMPGGTLQTTMGSYISNEDKLIIHKDAVLISQMGSEVFNDEGAELVLDGTFYCGCIGDGVNDHCWFINFGDISGSGKVSLYEAAPDDLPVADMDKLVSVVKGMIADGGGASIETDVVTLQFWTPGDINGDREVDNKDIVVLFRYVSGGNVEVNEIALDTNGDGEVDNKDIVVLFRYVSGGNIELSDKPYTPEK